MAVQLQDSEMLRKYQMFGTEWIHGSRVEGMGAAALARGSTNNALDPQGPAL